MEQPPQIDPPSSADTKKVEGINSQKTENILESAGAEKEIIEAEEIALAEISLRQKNFEELPPEKWAEAVEEALAAHPSIQKYEQFFQTYFKQARERNTAVNEIWTSIEKEAETQHIPSGVLLFKKVFRRDPLDSDKIEVEKELQLFTLRVSKTDFDAIHGNEISDSLGFLKKYLYTRTLPGNFLEHIYVPIAVYSESPTEIDTDNTKHHEIQHGLNDVDRWARGTTLKDILPLRQELAPSIQILYKRKEGALKELAKDEILAYIKGNFGGSNASSVAESPSEQQSRIKETEGFTEEIYALLTRGHYWEKFKDVHLPDADETADYQIAISAGLDSSMELLEFYNNLYGAESVDMVISVLQQFPLNNWPGVVRLVKKRHHEVGSLQA